MRVTDKHVYFWGEWLSNWFKCHFSVETEGKTLDFYNSEQYFMYIKAKTFGDEDIAQQIIEKGKNPKTAKALGRKVKNYNDEKWNEIRFDVMVEANMLKFSQNDDLKKLLLNPEFNGKHFVEASPLDGIWGIKCGEAEALDDESNWKGLNLLGKALDKVRENLS